MREISYTELKLNPMTMIAKQWMLITAGNEQNGCNTMTASWGHLGALWGRGAGSLPTTVIYIRPQRFTKEFVDREDYFTLSVLGEEYRKQLAWLGSHSGRDGNKFTATGLTPAYIDGTSYVAEAELVFVCRKLYHAPLQASGFVDPSIIPGNYPDKDFHEMYVGEILKVLQK